MIFERSREPKKIKPIDAAVYAINRLRTECSSYAVYDGYDASILVAALESALTSIQMGWDWEEEVEV